MTHRDEPDSPVVFQEQPDNHRSLQFSLLNPEILGLLRADFSASFESETACRSAIARAQALGESLLAKTTGEAPLGNTEGNCPGVRCPHCGASNSFLPHDALQQMHCNQCGESYALVGATETIGMESPSRRLGHFDLIEEIGSGSFGSVWRATDTELQRIVAVKIPRREAICDRDIQRFLHEARVAAGLKHPNIVSIHEIGRDRGTIYIVSDLVDGMTLEDFLSAQRLTARESIQLCSTIAGALQHAHERGIIHRDLKPGNIGLDSQLQPHVMDFGLALRNSAETTVTAEGRLLGTPAYMAPEQARGEGHTADARSDVYSLGVILFELLTGERPFRGNLRMLVHQVLHDEPPHPRKLNHSVPRDAATICLKCLEKSPDRRYPLAAALKKDLDRFLEGRPIIARPVGRLERGIRWTLRNRAVSLLAGLFLLSMLVGTTVSSWNWLHAVKSAKRARMEESKAIQAAESMQFQSAELLYQRGSDLCLNQQPSLGLHWMHQALQRFPHNPVGESARKLTLENILDWRRRLPKKHIQLQLPQEVTSCSFSLDGRILFTGEVGGVLRRFDLADGREMGEPLQFEKIKVASFGIWGISLHPDGQSLLASTGGQSTEQTLGRVYQVDCATGQVLRTVAEFPGFAEDAIFSPSGKWIAIVGGNLNEPGKLWLKDSQSEEFRGESLRLPSTYQEICFTEDEKHLVVEDRRDGKLQVVEVEGWKFISFNDSTSILASLGIEGSPGEMRQQVQNSVKEIHSKNLLPVRYHPDRSILLDQDSRGAVKIVDAFTRNPLITLTDYARGFSWDKTGERIVCYNEHQIHVWNFPWDQALRSLPSNSGDSTEVPTMKNARLCLDVGCRRAVVGTDKNVARIIDLDTGLPIGSPLHHPLPVVRVAAISPDGRYCATACQLWETVDCFVRLWDMNTGDPLSDWLPQANWVSTIAFSPDSRQMALGTYSSVALLWDLETMQQHDRHIKLDDILIDLAFSPDGKKLLIGTASDWSARPHAELWDLNQWQRIGPEFSHSHYVSHVSFSPDGKHCLTCSSDGVAKIWNAADGTPVSSIHFSSHAGPVCFVDEGRLLLTGSTDGVVRLWEISSGQPIRNCAFSTEGESVSALAVTSDGDRILVGYASGLIQMVDRSTFTRVGTPMLMRSSIHSLQWDSSSGMWAGLSESGNVALWPKLLNSAGDDAIPVRLDMLQQQLEMETGYAFDSEAQSVLPLTLDEWSVRKETLSQRTNDLIAIRPSNERNEMALSNRLKHVWEDSNWPGIEFYASRLLDKRCSRESENDEVEMPDWKLQAILADGAARRGSFAVAEEIYQKLYQLPTIASEVVQWQRQQVATCVIDENWSLAQHYLDRLISQDAEDWTLYRDRAQIHEKLGKPEQREQDLMRAVTLEPDRRFLLQIAFEKAELQNWEEAASLYDRVAENGYDNIKDMEGHIVSLIAIGEIDRLRDCFTRVLDDVDRRKPLTLGYTRTVVTLGYWGSLHPEDIPRYLALAEKASNRPLKDQPILQGQAMAELGWALYRCGRLTEAIDRFEEARSLLGRETEMAKLGLALSMAARGDIDAAKEVNSRLHRDSYYDQLPNQFHRTVFRKLTEELDRLISSSDSN